MFHCVWENYRSGKDIWWWSLSNMSEWIRTEKKTRKRDQEKVKNKRRIYLLLFFALLSVVLNLKTSHKNLSDIERNFSRINWSSDQINATVRRDNERGLIQIISLRCVDFDECGKLKVFKSAGPQRHCFDHILTSCLTSQVDSNQTSARSSVLEMFTRQLFDSKLSFVNSSHLTPIFEQSIFQF